MSCEHRGWAGPTWRVARRSYCTEGGIVESGDLTARALYGYDIVDQPTRQVLRSLAQAAETGALDSDDARTGAAALAASLLRDAAETTIPDRELSFEAFIESNRVVGAFLETVAQ